MANTWSGVTLIFSQPPEPQGIDGTTTFMPADSAFEAMSRKPGVLGELCLPCIRMTPTAPCAAAGAVSDSTMATNSATRASPRPIELDIPRFPQGLSQT